MINDTNNRFSISRWRDVVQSAANPIAQAYSTKLSVIAPFGFEVLGVQEWVLRPLKRYYVYIGCDQRPQDIEAHALQLAYITHLYAMCCKHWPEIFRNCGEVVTDFGAVKIRNPTVTENADTVTISCELRETNDILKEYAHYIIWTALNIENGKLSELGKCEKSRRARLRVLQLHLMHRTLFLKDRACDESAIRRCMFEKSNEHQYRIFRDIMKNVILPENAMIVSRVRQGEQTAFSGTGLHGENNIEITGNPDIINASVERIVGTYCSFPN